jgi:probable HAF family extracellular repeat protein
MQRPTHVVPVALVALAVWLAPPAGASPTAREVTRTILPPLPDADPAGATAASDIDNQGRVVGSSGDRPVLWHDGEVVELTGFPDDVVVHAAGEINDRGQIVTVGYSAAEGYPVHYLWQDGQDGPVVDEIELGPGLQTIQVFDLNERGQVLVSATNARGQAVVGIWQDGAFTEIGEWDFRSSPIADTDPWRYADIPRLSNGGHVAAQQIRGPCLAFPPAPSDCETRPVVWHDGELTVLPGGGGETTDVNARGDVIGTSLAHGGDVVWRDGQATALGMSQRDVNDRGQVAGIWRWWFLQRAAVWEDERLTVLGTLGGWNSWAYAINESGQVMGMSETASGERHIFLWDDGEMVDLTPHANDPDEDPWQLGLNDLGQVIGYSKISGPVAAELWQLAGTETANS